MDRIGWLNAVFNTKEHKRGLIIICKGVVMTKVEEFRNALVEILTLTEEELRKVAMGQSIWTQKQLEKLYNPK